MLALTPVGCGHLHLLSGWPRPVHADQESQRPAPVRCFSDDYIGRTPPVRHPTPHP